MTEEEYFPNKKYRSYDKAPLHPQGNPYTDRGNIVTLAIEFEFIMNR
jgi:hypothetical protein